MMINKLGAVAGVMAFLSSSVLLACASPAVNQSPLTDADVTGAEFAGADLEGVVGLNR
ncbi:hypothetical protein [Egbenema bharatensis]|uniref:hypothetical protein n=1 Tax=Egbenema bharatensis TaxID=3463334 RepID=UPI003A852E07